MVTGGFCLTLFQCILLYSFKQYVKQEKGPVFIVESKDSERMFLTHTLLVDFFKSFFTSKILSTFYKTIHIGPIEPDHILAYHRTSNKQSNKKGRNGCQ